MHRLAIKMIQVGGGCRFSFIYSFDNQQGRDIIGRMNPLIHLQIPKRSLWKRLAGCFIFLAFVIGVLLLPALHEMKSGEDKAHHDTCPTCQVAHIPMDVPVPGIRLIIHSPFAGDPVFAPPAVVQLSCQRDPTQARAPPAV